MLHSLNTTNRSMKFFDVENDDREAERGAVARDVPVHALAPALSSALISTRRGARIAGAWG